MKKIGLTAIGFATVLLSFTSCEKDNSEVTSAAEASTAEETRAPLSVDPTELVSAKTLDGKPQSIQELRERGVSVSQGLADYVGNLANLLWAANKSINQGNQLVFRYGFFRSEVRELRIIKAGYDALSAAPAPEPEPDPTPDPVDPDPTPTPAPPAGVVLTVADLNLSAAAQGSLGGSPVLGTDESQINSLVAFVSSNGAVNTTPFGPGEPSPNAYKNAGNGNIIDQNGVVLSPDALVNSLLNGLGGISSILDFPGDAIVEEFRPLALNAVNNLVTLLNAEGGSPISPPTGV